MKYSIALEEQLQWLRFEEEYAQTARADHREHYAGLADMARRAETYFWDAKLCPFLEKAASELPEWTLFAQDLPSPFGFLYFEKPIYETVDRIPVSEEERQQEHWTGEQTSYCRWIAWASQDDGLRFFYDTVDHSGHPSFFQPSPFEWQWNETRSFEGMNAALPPRGHGWTRIDQILFTAIAFMSQRIVTTIKQRPDRAARRRLGIPHEPVIRVIQLRARHSVVDSRGESEPQDWSCQWMVRGHWRNQPYKDGVRPRWIAPYVKGPEDKPLKPPRAIVFAVVR